MYLKIFVFSFCFFLMGCFFEPLYMNNEEIMKKTAAITVEPIAGEGGYQIGLALTTKLNPNQIDVPKKYRLIVSLSNPSTSNQSIRGDNFASIERMDVTVQYTLMDSNNNKLINSSINSNGIFNIVDDPYATVVAQDNL